MPGVGDARALEGLRRAAIKAGADDAKIIRAEDIKVGSWVRLKCRYGCDDYGRTLACPPYSPTPEEMRGILKEYAHALLVKISPPEIEGFSKYCHDLVFEIEREAFLMGHYKAFGLSSGSCPYCEECNLKSCIHPEKMRPSMEGCGIDVFATARNAGFEIGVCKDRKTKPSFYGLVLVE